MFCGNCGNKFTEESLFCMKCGSRVDTQNSTAGQNVPGQQQPQQNAYQQQPQQNVYQQQPQQNAYQQQPQQNVYQQQPQQNVYQQQPQQNVYQQPQEQYAYQQQDSQYPQYRRSRQAQNTTMQSVKAFASSKTGLIVIGAAVVIILIIVIVSNTGGSSLVGRWEATTVTFEMMGERHTEYLSSGETIIELNADGTGTMIEPGHWENITWTTSRGELNITGSAAWPMPSLRYNISGRTLTLEYQEFGASVTMTLRRVS